MALKVELKPGERVIIGDCVITNSDQRTRFLIEGDTPILREKDILTAKSANTPAKRIYLAIQLMYIDEKNLAEYHAIYWKIVKDVVGAAPSTLVIIDQISDHILGGRYYQALKLAKQLIEYEQEVVKNVR
jgi:flagellar protein FlbT